MVGRRASWMPLPGRPAKNGPEEHGVALDSEGLGSLDASASPDSGPCAEADRHAIMVFVDSTILSFRRPRGEAGCTGSRGTDVPTGCGTLDTRWCSSDTAATGSSRGSSNPTSLAAASSGFDSKSSSVPEGRAQGEAIEAPWVLNSRPPLDLDVALGITSRRPRSFPRTRRGRPAGRGRRGSAGTSLPRSISSVEATGVAPLRACDSSTGAASRSKSLRAPGARGDDAETTQTSRVKNVPPQTPVLAGPTDRITVDEVWLGGRPAEIRSSGKEWPARHWLGVCYALCDRLPGSSEVHRSEQWPGSSRPQEWF